MFKTADAADGKVLLYSEELMDAFCAEMDRLLGAKSCHRLSIRPVGGVLLEVLE